MPTPITTGRTRVAAALLCSAAGAWAQSSSGRFLWSAESGLLPSAAPGGMALVDSSPARDPVLAGSVLTLATDTNPEFMLFRHAGAALDWNGALQIDARLMLGPGSSRNPGPNSPRSHASIVFFDAEGNGNALFIAEERAFLLAGGDVLGASAPIAADGDFHDWRITVAGTGAGSAVTVSFDGTLAAQGSSQWVSFACAVTAVPEPATALTTALTAALTAALGLPLLRAWRRQAKDKT